MLSGRTPSMSTCNVTVCFIGQWTNQVNCEILPTLRSYYIKAVGWVHAASSSLGQINIKPTSDRPPPSLPIPGCTNSVTVFRFTGPCIYTGIDRIRIRSTTKKIFSPSSHFNAANTSLLHWNSRYYLINQDGFGPIMGAVSLRGGT